MQVLLSVPERRRFHVNPTSCFSFVVNFDTLISDRRRFFFAKEGPERPKKGRGVFGVSFGNLTLRCGVTENVSDRRAAS